jgi:small subunit ribosomal protein S4
MARTREPVGKLSRKLGIGITEKGQRILNRRPNLPGQHGPDSGRKKTSEYAKRLLEKQRARFLYGLMEGQFRRTFDKAGKLSGAHGENLLILLERRLDNVIYRLGYGRTRAQARQLVNHGHFAINGRKTDRPSFTIRKGDLITVLPNKQETTYYKLLREDGRFTQYAPPAWLSLDKGTLAAEVLALPTRADAEQAVNEQLIVEFYSGR